MTSQITLWRRIAAAVLIGLFLAVAACAPRPTPPPTPTAPVSKTFPSLAPTAPTAVTGAAVGQSTAGSAAPTAASAPAVSAAAPPAAGNAASGQPLFAANCNVCHPNAQAGVGPAIAGPASKAGSAADVTRVIRQGKGAMPPFSADRITDPQLADLLAYLGTLQTTSSPAAAAPTTAAATPLPPTSVPPTPVPASTPSPVSSPATVAPPTVAPAPALPTAVPATVAPAPAQPTAAPPPAPAAGGNPQAGQAVFSANCNMCHPNGQAGVGPSLVGIAAAQGESDLKQVVRAGRGPMPPFPASRISDQQLSDLIAYLKGLQ